MARARKVTSCVAIWLSPSYASSGLVSPVTPVPPVPAPWPRAHGLSEFWALSFRFETPSLRLRRPLNVVPSSCSGSRRCGWVCSSLLKHFQRCVAWHSALYSPLLSRSEYKSQLEKSPGVITKAACVYCGCWEAATHGSWAWA